MAVLREQLVYVNLRVFRYATITGAYAMWSGIESNNSKKSLTRKESNMGPEPETTRDWVGVTIYNDYLYSVMRWLEDAHNIKLSNLEGFRENIYGKRYGRMLDHLSEAIDSKKGLEELKGGKD